MNSFQPISLLFTLRPACTRAARTRYRTREIIHLRIFSNTKGFKGPFTPPDVANTNILSNESTDLRCIAAAGLKVVKSDHTLWSTVAGEVGSRRKGKSKGWFIDVGGHAIAVFTVCDEPAVYEKPYRFYFFDPNAGCFFSDEDSPYREMFQLLRKTRQVGI